MNNFEEAIVNLSEQAKSLQAPEAHVLHCEVTPHDDEPGALMVLVEIDNGHTLATTVRGCQAESKRPQELWASCVSAVGLGLAMSAA